MSPLSPKLLLSGIFGLIYGVIGYFVLFDVPNAGRWALILGLGAFALLLLGMLLNESRRARRYAKAEKLLPCSPQLCAGAHFREGRKVSSVNVYVCGEELVLLNVEKRTPTLTRIPRDLLRSAEMDASVELRLTLTDGRVLLLLSPYMEVLIRHLRMIGWSISEPRK